MAFNVSLERLFPGLGVSVRNDAVYVQSGISLSGTSVQSNPIPASGSLAYLSTAGRIRVKIYNGAGTSPTVVAVVVTAYDGTNTVTIGSSSFNGNDAVTLSATSWYEQIFEYLVDTGTTVSGNQGSVGQLLVGGATVFNVRTTLGGTSPTASMDVAIVPLI